MRRTLHILRVLFVTILLGARCYSEPPSCHQFSLLVSPALKKWEKSLEARPLYYVLKSLNLEKHYLPGDRKRVADYQNKVKALVESHRRLGPASDEYQKRVLDLLDEGVLLAQKVSPQAAPELLPALASAYVLARREHPEFWQGKTIAGGKDWDELVRRAEKERRREEREKRRSENPVEQRPQTVKSFGLENVFSDRFDVVEHPLLSVYLAGARGYSLELMGKKLAGDVDRYQELARTTGDKGYLKDAANIIATMKKMGIPVEIPPELKAQVDRAVERPFDQTPLLDLDRHMKSIAVGKDENGKPLVSKWMQDFQEEFNRTGKIPSMYAPLVSGSIMSTDGTHHEVMILRHPSSGIHAFFEVDRLMNGKVKLTDRNEALVHVAGKDMFFKNAAEEDTGKCGNCHRGASARANPRGNGEVGGDTEGPFRF